MTTSGQNTAYSIEHATLDPYARSGRDWVFGSERYRQSATNTVETLFPWPGICGCWHSHPYCDEDRLPGVTGFSEDDRHYFEKKLRTRAFPETMRIYLVLSIHGQRGRQREQRRNQLKWSLGQYRLTLDSYYAAKAMQRRDFELLPRHREWPQVHKPSRVIVTLLGAPRTN
jgi:hypothetical protein